MFHHILIDLLDRDLYVEKSITGVVDSKCRLLHREIESNISIYRCIDGFVYLTRRGDVLLIDIIDAEWVFEDILKHLPIEYAAIRLVERGISPQRG